MSHKAQLPIHHPLLFPPEAPAGWVEAVYQAQPPTRWSYPSICLRWLPAHTKGKKVMWDLISFFLSLSSQVWKRKTGVTASLCQLLMCTLAFSPPLWPHNIAGVRSDMSRKVIIALELFHFKNGLGCMMWGGRYHHCKLLIPQQCRQRPAAWRGRCFLSVWLVRHTDASLCAAGLQRFLWMPGCDVSARVALNLT